MSADLPAPPVPAEVDLRGLEYMPLFGNHLFGSEFNARSSDAEWRAGLTLWWAAWNQVPGASLPDDDIALARLADFGRDVRRWRRVKTRALHGFVLCSDGRLYHRFLAEQAKIAWEKRVREREKKRQWRERQAAQRDRDTTDQGPGQDRDRGVDVPGDVTGRDVTGRDDIKTLTPLGGTSPPDAGFQTESRAKTNGAASKERLADAEDVIAFLNKSCGRNYPVRTPSGTITSNAKVVVARLQEGYTRTQLREVVAMLARKWRGDVDMARYLRPETIFGPKKFSGYIGQISGQQ